VVIEWAQCFRPGEPGERWADGVDYAPFDLDDARAGRWTTPAWYAGHGPIPREDDDAVGVTLRFERLMGLEGEEAWAWEGSVA